MRLLGTRGVGDARGGRAREGGVSARCRRRRRHGPGRCRRALSISPRHPAAPCTRTPRSRVCGSPARAGVAADCGAGGGTAPVPSPPSSLLADSRVMGNTAIAKKGSEVESGESRRRPRVGSRRMGLRPPRPRASHGPGLAAASGTSRLLLCPLPHEGSGVRAKHRGSLERGKAGRAVPVIPFLTRARRAATVWNASPNMVLL